MAPGSASVPTPRIELPPPAAAARVQPHAPTPWRARVLRSVALLAVFAVALEITCRLDDRIRFGTPMFSRVLSQGDLMVRDARGAHGRPNSRYQKWVMNNLGMRGPNATPLPTPGTIRVLTLGASETFGLYESPGREYPRQLEDSLRASRPGPACVEGRAPTGVEVLNAALPGMSLPTVQQDVRMRLSALRPDVVVLYATPPQYLDAHPPVATRPDSGAGAGELAWQRALWPRAFGRIRDQVKQMLPAAVQSWLRRQDIHRSLQERPADWRFTGVPAERLAGFERDLRDAVGAIRAAGAEPVLATHVNAFVGAATIDQDRLFAWERFYPRAPGRVIIAFDSAANEVTRRVARDSGATVADLERAVGTGEASLFADFSHFTDAGAAQVAGVLSRAVVRAHAGGACRAAETTPPALAPAGPVIR